ncbi:MAG: LuxR C-terminal-related transcriptional regulator [Pseudonocardiaceae bacterium]
MDLTAERVRARIAALATAGLDVATFTDAACEVLNRALPFAVACLATTDPATKLVTGGAKWGSEVTDDFDEQWAYFEYDGPEPYHFQNQMVQAGGVSTAVRETGGDIAASARFTDFFVPHWDFHDEARIALDTDGTAWGYLSLFRDGHGATFTATDLDVLLGVRAALAVGLRVGLLAAIPTEPVPAVDGPAVLVVDRADELVQASVGAAAMIAELGGGPIGETPLPLWLRVLVGAARQFHTGRFPSVPRTRMRSRTGRWVVAQASPLLARDGTGTDVVLTVEEARPPEIVPLVVAAFGLTRREQDVVALVLQGIDTGEVARTLQLSGYTVQDHLKSIFTKAGVRSRRELIAKVFYDQYAPRMATGTGVGVSGWFSS